MKVDLSTLPFSCRGSWLAISELGKNWNDCGNEAGLYLRTIHSSAMTPLVARLLPERKEYTAEIRQAALLLTTGDGMLEICFDDPGTMLIRGTSGMRLTLVFLSGSGPYDYIYRFSRNGRTYEMANCFKNNCRYLMSAEQGEAELEQEWRESSSVYSRLIVSGKAGFLLVLREIETEWDGIWKQYDFEESRDRTAADLLSFRRRLPAFLMHMRRPRKRPATCCGRLSFGRQVSCPGTPC